MCAAAGWSMSACAVAVARALMKAELMLPSVPVHYGTFSRVKRMSERVSELALWRLTEKAMPTCEKRRSTVAELAGQPRYCRAITERLGNFLAFSAHHLSASHSVWYGIWGSARC